MTPSADREEMQVTRHAYSVLSATICGVACSVALTAQQPEAPAPLPREQAREHNLRAYTELLRSDLRTQKVALITQMMQFTEAEDTAFWPIYRQYEVDLAAINDKRLAAIETYAKTYTHMTAPTADELVITALDLEARRTALKQKYYTTLKAAVSSLTAARALQIENQVQLLIDLQVAASLPVVQ
jgi:hypothetical protein